MSKTLFRSKIENLFFKFKSTVSGKNAEAVGVELGKCSVNQFSDGEIQVNIEESIRGSHV